jgi:hypothetical protein
MVHGMPEVADFGLAVTMEEFVAGDVLLAAPEYRAPEARPGAPVAVTWDVYSFGVMLAEMLTGEILAPGTTVRSFPLRSQARPGSMRSHRPQTANRCGQA